MEELEKSTKSKMLTIRASDEDLQGIAEGMETFGYSNRSAYLLAAERAQREGRRLPPAQARLSKDAGKLADVLIALQTELQRQGHNANQFTREAHSGRLFDVADSALQNMAINEDTQRQIQHALKQVFGAASNDT